MLPTTTTTTKPTPEDLQKISNLIFRGDLNTSEYYQKKYPPRKLAQDSLVTRIAPSPTGFMHIGGIYAGLISERLAHQSKGLFYLRIEDTDQKREVTGATNLIVNSLSDYNITIDEGQVSEDHEKGQYGPYKQSERKTIYRTHIKELILKDKAYICFCSTDELDTIRKTQEVAHLRTGYYGQLAKWRDASADEVISLLKQGIPYVVRFKSSGSHSKRIIFDDLIKGHLSQPENDVDVVLMKSDGLPTYHLAHIVDDHLMRTTHVIRGDEWLSSVNLHLELFHSFGWTPPQYAHISPICKQEGNSRRKLSKRKDPEANVAYYDQQGYPKEAVIDYLLNLANPNFEPWRKNNPTKSNQEFPLSFTDLSNNSGALFDLVKLADFSRDHISTLSAQEVYDQSLAWAKKHDQPFARLIEENPHYTKSILNIERQGDNPRKDLEKWSDLPTQIGYFYDQIYKNLTFDKVILDKVAPDLPNIINDYISIMNFSETKEEWLDKLRNIAEGNGYAPNIKSFKNNPSKYKGHFGDVAMILRVILVGKNQSPDLYEIINVMRKNRVLDRLINFSL